MKVSVIVPVYNVERHLRRCIDSVIGQSFSDVELILIDDGSTDESGRICDDYRMRDNRIKVIHQENAGVSAARNAGLDIATGEYILFLDGDDALDLNTLEVCTAALQRSDSDLVLFGFHLYGEKDGKAFFQKDIVYEEAVIASHEELLKDFSAYYQQGWFSFVTDKLIRASLIHDHDIRFDGAFNVGGEDAVFMLALLPYIDSIKVLPDTFYQYYRREGESMTLVFKPDKFQRYCDRIVLMSRFMTQNGCFDGAYLVRLLGTYFLWAYESMLKESCRYTLTQRFRYVTRTFINRELFQDQKSYERALLSDLSCYNDYSRSSVIALKLFFQKRVLTLGIWHVITYIRTR